MCGITGWLSFQRDVTRCKHLLSAMTATQACRGPDAEGLWLGRHIGLGHRRLSVIDLDGGTQPMSVDTPAGPVVLTYSGEAYNFAELRDELRRRGHEFRTASDTEVVLRGYLEWGEGVAGRLNGMYAFAVWDGRDEKLVLVRDRMGVKPLYIHPTDDGVLFGSEPKAILANPLVEPTVGLDGMRELMIGFCKTPGQAIWHGMREVLPGTVVSVDRSGLREHPYWRLAAAEHPDGTEATVSRVRDLLEDIVRRQLVADVPLCVLLSGGLDSSAITALAAQRLGEQGEPVRSFAVDLSGQTTSFKADAFRAEPDTPYAHEVARHVGAGHRDILLEPVTLTDPEVRRATIAARDLPTGLGDMDSSLYLLFMEIREHSTVALSGEAADEVFGGYRWFHDPATQRADTFPWVATPYHGPHKPVEMLDPGVLADLDVATYLRDRYAEAVAQVPYRDGEDEHERRLRRACYLHLTQFLPTLLDRKDRISMAVGLEVRVPFCDHRLVEYVFNTPWSMKTFDGQEKSLLRAAVRDLIPASVAARAKSPYPAAQDPRHTAALQSQVRDLIAAGHRALDLFERGSLTAMAARPPAEVDRRNRLVLEKVLDFAVWFDLRRPTIRW
jgi:asparagine synthase (glutamine-hydrolysing)